MPFEPCCAPTTALQPPKTIACSFHRLLAYGRLLANAAQKPAVRQSFNAKISCNESRVLAYVLHWRTFSIGAQPTALMTEDITIELAECGFPLQQYTYTMMERATGYSNMLSE